MMMMMRIGKHRGRTFEEICSIDRPYCAWILRVKPAGKSAALQSFYLYLRKEHGGLLEVGRHKGLFFDEVANTEQEYCLWVASQHCTL